MYQKGGERIKTLDFSNNILLMCLLASPGAKEYSANSVNAIVRIASTCEQQSRSK